MLYKAGFLDEKVDLETGVLFPSQGGWDCFVIV